MTLKTPFEIRDPVHGLIRLTEQEKRIIDTRAFQRLRGFANSRWPIWFIPGPYIHDSSIPSVFFM